MGKLTQLKLFPQFSYDCGLSNTSKFNDNSLTFLLDSLLHVMNRSLPIINAPSGTIVFSDAYGCPICFRQTRFIFLSSPLTQWSRVAYQLAHEMCHFVIGSDVPQNLRWLEESICELSSYYFLPRLAKYWKQNNIASVVAETNEPYYFEFERYVKRDQKKAVSFNLSSFTDDIPPIEL